jgi:hypothetical protein
MPRARGGFLPGLHPVRCMSHTAGAPTRNSSSAGGNVAPMEEMVNADSSRHATAATLAGGRRSPPTDRPARPVILPLQSPGRAL